MVRAGEGSSSSSSTTTEEREIELFRKEGSKVGALVWEERAVGHKPEEVEEDGGCITIGVDLSALDRSFSFLFFFNLFFFLFLNEGIKFKCCFGLAELHSETLSSSFLFVNKHAFQN